MITTKTTFVATDGTEFTSIEQAHRYQSKLDEGVVVTCPNCNGEGKIDPYGDGRMLICCDVCKGIGKVEKYFVPNYRALSI